MTGQVITSAQRKLQPPLVLEAPLHDLRVAFAQLMDGVQVQLHRRGLEIDSCVLDRFARVRVIGRAEEYVIPVESVTDRACLLDALAAKIAQEGGQSLTDARVEVLEIAVEAVRTPDFPLVR